MPARRSFAPLPMNEAQHTPHGREMTPPNLAQAPQPLPPSPAPAAPSPSGPAAMPGAAAGGAQPGMTPQRPPLPASIPLAPMQPKAPTSAGTVSPVNAQPFLHAGGDDPQAPLSTTLLKLLGALGHTGEPYDAGS